MEAVAVESDPSGARATATTRSDGGHTRRDLSPTNAHPIHGTIGQNGVLCRPGDFRALMLCMDWLAALDRDELAAMGEASRHLVEREFNVRDVNDVIHRRLFDGI